MVAADLRDILICSDPDNRCALWQGGKALARAVLESTVKRAQIAVEANNQWAVSGGYWNQQ